MDNPKNVAEDFNDYFVGIGTTLAREIVVPDDKKDTLNDLINSNIRSMFISGVNENDVTDTERQFKNKRSSDINDIDMVIIKEVRPLTYICHLSFQKGIFLII